MRRICKLCGDEFEVSASRQVICPKKHYQPCPVCGKPVEWKGGIRTCSKECAAEKRRRTSMERYGVPYAARHPDIKAKMQSTLLKNYGVTNPTQNKEILARRDKTFNERFGKLTNPEGHKQREERRRATLLERYGTDDYLNSDEGRARAKQSNLERYGYEYASQNPEIKEKARQTMLERYGVDNSFELPHVIATRADNRDKAYAQLSGRGIYDSLQKHVNSTDEISSVMFISILDALDIPYTRKFEVDGKVYDLKVGDTLVCLDTTLTHNKYAVKGIRYHQRITEHAQANGYDVIHVYDWDDPVIVGMMLRDKVTVYARDCVIEELDRPTCDAFLKMYHTQGTVTGQKVRYGLYYNNRLVQVMTFGASRYRKEYEWELLRMCSDPEIVVTGGASKLFNHFIKEHSPKSIVSYCDRSKFGGKVYEKLGMELFYLTEPSMVWSRGAEKTLDRVLNTAGYDNLFGTSFGKTFNNSQLMQDNGWLPVYDCGQAVYSWKHEDE